MSVMNGSLAMSRTRPAIVNTSWEVSVFSELEMEWLVMGSTENEESALDQYFDLVRRGNTTKLVKVTTTRQTVKLTQ